MKKIYEQVIKLNSVDNVSTAERLCKLFEEVGEMAQAVNKIIGRKRHNQTPDEIKIDIAEEAADTIQNVFSVCDSCGIKYEEIVEMLKTKNKKWENKLIKKEPIKIEESKKEGNMITRLFQKINLNK